jgi:anti-sigma factor RsiW
MNMNTSFECERTLLVQADFDGELSAAEAAESIRHERDCVHCRQAREQISRARELMRAVPRFDVSPELRASMQRRLRAEVGGAESGAASPVDSPKAGAVRDSVDAFEHPRTLQRAQRSRYKAFGWATGLAAAAALAIVLLLPPGASDVSSQLVANNLRAMQLDSHLIDVASSEHHTVKPWFAGKVSFAPPVKDLESDGYVLKGGRVDIVQGAPAAVLVYGAGRHVLDVYVWPAKSGSNAGVLRSTVDGFQMRHWEEGGLALWCVSDMGAPEMDRFVERWQSR